MRKAIFVLLICFIPLSISAEVSKIIAKVNNEAVTSKDLDDYIKIISSRIDLGLTGFSSDGKKLREEVLQSLIEDRLILDEAKREKIEISYNRIEEKFSQMVSDYPSMEEFEKSMVEKGLSSSLVKKRIKEQFLSREIIEKYVKLQANVLPQEISQYYQTHLDEFSSPLTYVIWIAKSEDRDFIGEIAKTIDKKGIDYAQEHFSGDLIKIESAESELVEAISKVLREIREKDYIIREIEGVFHLIYLGGTVPVEVVPLEEVKEKISSFLLDKKVRENFAVWIKKLKEKAVIKVY